MSNKILPENIFVSEGAVKAGLESHNLDVRRTAMDIALKIADQTETHDNDKLAKLDKWTLFRKLDATGYKFGTPEYLEFRELLYKQHPELKEIVQEHTKSNRHHPEFFNNDFSKMNIIDIVELISDWYVASTTRKSGNKTFEEMMDYNSKRFNIDPQLKGIILNTLNYIKEQNAK